MWEAQISTAHRAKFQQHKIKEEEEIQEMASFKAYSLHVLNAHRNKAIKK